MVGANMTSENRFAGRLAEEYELITLAYPDFEEFQRGLARHLAEEVPPQGRVLEIGTGDGFTTDIILQARCDIHLVSVDMDPVMVRQATARMEDPIRAGRLEVVCADALAFLREGHQDQFDAVVSAFTLHNIPVDHRSHLEEAIFAALRPGGVFVNADKYAPDDEQQRFEALQFQVGRFFEAFVPLGKIDLLREWVIHNIADQSPRFVMREHSAEARMREVGFVDVQVGERSHMQAVLAARKPG
jgi:spermidine synthase